MPQIPLADKDACQLLDADHLAVKHLFVEYARLAYAEPQDSPTDRGDIATGICEELSVHAQIEEEIFYPALRKALPDAAELVDEGLHEHQKVKDLVAQIQAMGGVASPEMDDLVAQLACLVEHHVKEERDEMFPKARACPELDLVALGDQLRERQQSLQAAAGQPA